MFYEEPKFEVILFEEEDIITASGLNASDEEYGDKIDYNWSKPF